MQAAAICLNSIIPVYFGTNLVFGPSMLPPNLDLVDTVFDYANVNCSVLPPSCLDEIGSSPMVLNKVKKHKFLGTGGGESTITIEYIKT